jgi:DNA-binding MarR family transcriptional regulator
MKDIEKYFDCSHATVFGLLKRLEEKGRVEILPDESDKRAKTVRVTELEKKNFSKIKGQRMLLEETLLKDFSEEEKKQVSEYLCRIYKNLE